MPKLLQIFILCCTVLLVSCAKKEKERIIVPVEPPKPLWTASSCQTTDWHHIGRSQAYNGRIDIDITDIADECADLGVKINTDAYFNGLRERANEYCTITQARILGQEGASYPNLCQAEIYTEFHYEWYRSIKDHCYKHSNMAEICRELSEQ